jgi:hypothetical protein
MLDLVSTREDIDPQTAANAKLLAAIIADAVRQASQKPSKQEQAARRNLDHDNYHPGLSIWFLFNDESVFKTYAQLIGLEAQAFRDAFLSDRTLKERTVKGQPAPFTSMERRVIKQRYAWYREEQVALRKAQTH